MVSFEDLPGELLLEIFSYFSPFDLDIAFLSLSNARLSNLISHLDLSLDLTYTSLSRFLYVLTHCSASRIVFLRLTNRYSHGLLISEFFTPAAFRPERFVRLRSLHLDDMVGNEIDCLPPFLEKLSVKFHKKAAYATKFYQLALQSTTLKQCYLIGAYAFDSKTCSPISSSSIERLHMAIKSFPNDLFVVLQALPALLKLKTRVYSRSSGSSILPMAPTPLKHLNIDLQGSGISFTMLDAQLLSHLPRLQSLIYHCYGKFHDDMSHLGELSTRFRRVQFIQKGLSVNTDVGDHALNHNLVTAVQEVTNQEGSRRTLTLHTVPYPDKVLHLPFVHWNGTDSSVEKGIYDRVERVRIHLTEAPINPNFPPCHHVQHLTLMLNNDTNPAAVSSEVMSSFIRPSSIRHLIINTQACSVDLNRLAPLRSLHSLDIACSQLRPYSFLSTVKALFLTSECISWREIEHLVHSLMPQLEHLQMNVTTSDECREILNVLLLPGCQNNLISIKICICQTLSDQIKQDLEPILLSSKWIRVKWRMDSWYLYIWK